MLTDTPAATRSTRRGAALVDWKFLVACLGMAGLLVLSLFTGVYDVTGAARSEEHTSELQSRGHLVCRLLLEKKNSDVSVREMISERVWLVSLGIEQVTQWLRA